MMAVDLIGPSSLARGRPPAAADSDDAAAIQEAASAGLRGIESLLSHLSSSQQQQQQQQQQVTDYREITDRTVSKFRRLISVLNRTGHARFRRGPAAAPLPQQPEPAAAPPPVRKSVTLDFTKPSFSVSSANSSFNLSSVTGEGSVSNGKQGSPKATMLLPAPPAIAAGGRPPISGVTTAGVKRRVCHDHAHSENVVNGKYGSNGGRCHCTKRRKSRVKKTIRVPAISSKNADIPPDDYSWRKYGQKPIKGSPYPRGYYKCSTRRGCPARKHVERDPHDPSMLIVTYEGEHHHQNLPAEQQTSVPAPVTARSESLI